MFIHPIYSNKLRYLGHFTFLTVIQINPIFLIYYIFVIFWKMFPSFIGIDTLCDDNAIWWRWYWNRNTTNIHTFVQLQFWRIWQFLTNIFLINASEILSFLEYGVEGKSRSFWCMKISINITNQITDIKDFGLWKPDAMKMICYKALRRICSRDNLCY